jgi:uncharacterized protein YoxC
VVIRSHHGAEVTASTGGFVITESSIRLFVTHVKPVLALLTERAVMAKKSWNQLTTDEKLEALREDVAQAYNVLNGLISDVGDIHRRVNKIDATMTAVLTDIEALKRQSSKSAA